MYIGVSNKTGGNTDGKASGTTVVVNNSNGSNTGDNTGDKVMGEANVIVVADHIHNILIAAWPSYLREDEGLVRIL